MKRKVRRKSEDCIFNSVYSEDTIISKHAYDTLFPRIRVGDRMVDIIVTSTPRGSNAFYETYRKYREQPTLSTTGEI
jgi:hypothetical protein